jgi:hypothetical protein
LRVTAYRGGGLGGNMPVAADYDAVACVTVLGRTYREFECLS